VASLDNKILKESAKIRDQETKDKILDALKLDSKRPAIAAKQDEKALPPPPTLGAESSKTVAGIPNVDDLMGEPKYSVKDVVGGKGWIRVEINETISQVAEWLNVGVDDLRKWNAIEDRGQARPSKSSRASDKTIMQKFEKIFSRIIKWISLLIFKLRRVRTCGRFVFRNSIFRLGCSSSLILRLFCGI
jgi:hypothetical protein